MKFGVQIDELKVGEYNAMNLSGMSFSTLNRIQTKYLKSLIATLEASQKEDDHVPLPALKFILFCATEIQDMVKKDKHLSKAIAEAQIEHDMAKIFGQLK